jgi:hypothetical protein
MTNSDRGQDLSGLFEILNESLPSNKFIQTVDQYRIDFPSVTHIEHHYISFNFHFHHIDFKFLAYFILADLYCVEQAFWLIVNVDIVPYIYTLQ